MSKWWRTAVRNRKTKAYGSQTLSVLESFHRMGRSSIFAWYLKLWVGKYLKSRFITQNLDQGNVMYGIYLFVVMPNAKAPVGWCWIVVYSASFYLVRTMLIANNGNIVNHTAVVVANHTGILDDCDILQTSCPFEAFVQWPPTNEQQINKRQFLVLCNLNL